MSCPRLGNAVLRLLSTSERSQAGGRTSAGGQDTANDRTSTATVTRIAYFFVHLRRDKGMSVSSIKGYQSALNSVFALKGQDLSSSRELSMLVRSFAVSCPPAEVRPPAWDLSLVLRSLKTAPYEPLASVSERFVGLKALFLLALASSKRVGELH